MTAGRESRGRFLLLFYSPRDVDRPPNSRQTIAGAEDAAQGSGSGSHEHAEKVSALFPGEVRILERVARAAAG